MSTRHVCKLSYICNMYIGTTNMSFLNYRFDRVLKQVVHVYEVIDTNNCIS